MQKEPIRGHERFTVRGQHTHPHVDSRKGGQRVAEMLLATLRGEIRPVMSAVKILMITPAETQLTEECPMRELMEATRHQEEDEGVPSSSALPCSRGWIFRRWVGAV